jgi:UMF1 family MFS transporter
VNKKKQIGGWVLYDWANSAFATTVMAGFFPVFFKKFWSDGIDINDSTLMLGITNSLASLIVAVTVPIMGAIADKGQAKKKFLIFFAYLGSLMTLGLFFINQGQWIMASVVFGVGMVGFSSANSFYDSLLPGIVDENNIDYVSGLGYAAGYFGGGLLFTLNVLMTQKPEWFGLATEAEGIRFSFITVGLWWGIFTVPLMLWVHEKSRPIFLSQRIIKEGFKEMSKTFHKIKQLRYTLLFLIAYWLYIDGVDTIVRMAVDFGISIGLNSSDLIIALLITQFVGFPAAIAYGKLGQKWDVKKALYLGIVIYSLITLFGMQMTTIYEFFGLAIAIGLIQGGVQALSRSFYSRLIPKGHEGEFYGFYNMLGKFAAIVGPALMGICGLIMRKLGYSQNIASRAGIASIIILFIAGALLLYKVDENQGKIDAQKFAHHELV